MIEIPFDEKFTIDEIESIIREREKFWLNQFINPLDKDLFSKIILDIEIEFRKAEYHKLEKLSGVVQGMLGGLNG